VDLNVTDMRTESVVYRADSNDVALQMESLKADTTTEVRESARIVSGFTTLAPSGSTIGNICVDKDQSREAAAKTNC
jgi:hypothetical protein